MRDGKDESESVRWPLRQGAGNRARLPRHASRHRVRPGRRRNCCRSRQAPAWWCGSADSGACCAGTARKKAFGTAEQPVLRVLTLASCGGKRARKKHDVTLGSCHPATEPVTHLSPPCRLSDRKISTGCCSRRRASPRRPTLCANGTNGAGRSASRPSSGRRRPAVRRRPPKVPCLRRHHRLQSAPAHGRPNAPAAEDQDEIAVPPRLQHGQKQGTAQKPRREDLCARRGETRRLPLNANRCPEPFGKVTATSN